MKKASVLLMCAIILFSSSFIGGCSILSGSEDPDLQMISYILFADEPDEAERTRLFFTSVATNIADPHPQHWLQGFALLMQDIYQEDEPTQTVTPSLTPSPSPSFQTASETSTMPIDDPSDSWIGSWSGTMLITKITTPEKYSADERESLLSKASAMEFNITKYADGYSLTSKQMQGGQPAVTIKDDKITINFEASASGVTIYQIFTGTISQDADKISGQFATGKTGEGDVFTGVWSVTRK